MIQKKGNMFMKLASRSDFPQRKSSKHPTADLLLLNEIIFNALILLFFVYTLLAAGDCQIMHDAWISMIGTGIQV